MSWDVFIFHLKNKVTTIEEIADEGILPIDNFVPTLQSAFPEMQLQDGWIKIEREGYSIESSDTEGNNTRGPAMLQLQGKMAIYPLIDLCKKNNWQLFDTWAGIMLDLDDPAKNGYADFQRYLTQITK